MLFMGGRYHIAWYGGRYRIAWYGRAISHCLVWTGDIASQQTVTSPRTPHNFSVSSCFLNPTFLVFHTTRVTSQTTTMQCAAANVQPCKLRLQPHTDSVPSIASRRSEAALGCPNRRRDTIKGTLAPQSIHHSPHPPLPSPAAQQSTCDLT
jgi:hypothetical protein